MSVRWRDAEQRLPPQGRIHALLALHAHPASLLSRPSPCPGPCARRRCGPACRASPPLPAAQDMLGGAMKLPGQLQGWPGGLLSWRKNSPASAAAGAAQGPAARLQQRLPTLRRSPESWRGLLVHAVDLQTEIDNLQPPPSLTGRWRKDKVRVWLPVSAPLQLALCRPIRHITRRAPHPTHTCRRRATAWRRRATWWRCPGCAGRPLFACVARSLIHAWLELGELILLERLLLSDHTLATLSTLQVFRKAILVLNLLEVGGRQWPLPFHSV